MRKLDFWRADWFLGLDPNQRYQDGEQMAKALQLCLRSLPGSRRAVQPAPAAGV